MLRLVRVTSGDQSGYSDTIEPKVWMVAISLIPTLTYAQYICYYYTMNKHRFNLIIPESLWKSIKTLADNNHRSVTQEIILALETHLTMIWIKVTKNDLENSNRLRFIVDNELKKRGLDNEAETKPNKE